MSDLTLKDMMRQDKAATESAPALDLGPIKKVLGDDHPPIDETQVGRIRLVRALAQKYGMGYRSNPDVKGALDHYDKEVKFLNLYKKALGGRYE